MKRAAILLFAAVSGAASAQLPYLWSDQTGDRDMPWLGSGGRARWYVRDVTSPLDIMNPRGPTIEKHWGSSGRSGESPYDTGDRAVAYLERIGALAPWPTYPPVDNRPAVTAFPYRITIVCIEPTVAILRFDLSAAIPDPIEFSFGAFPPSRQDHSPTDTVSGGRNANDVMFGTRVSTRGSLWWFSPDAQVPPTPLDISSGRAKIAVRGVTLELVRRGDELEVRR
jgi:hypothetical protein